jgi:hypothetical protein
MKIIGRLCLVFSTISYVGAFGYTLPNSYNSLHRKVMRSYNENAFKFCEYNGNDLDGCG